MKLNYSINKIKHSIVFCKNNKIEIISKSIASINSDKNVLFVYDGKIDKKIVNDIFFELKLSGCKVVKIECAAEKLNKNEKLLFRILDVLLANNFTRKSIIISLGGGVIGDVSALASSLYLRGLNYICIPTTMTAIVDSSIGGKTAINYKGITNSVGTYYHPKLVFILDKIIKTLPEREFIAGLAEVIKCGIISDKKIISLLQKNRSEILRRKSNVILKLCYLTLKTKIKFFINDIYEEDKRLSLNFGHTFAHAIEMAIDKNSKKDNIRHGEAVGIGMLCEIYYEKKKKEKIFKITKSLLENYKLPTYLSLKNTSLNKVNLQNIIYKNIFLDKKRLNKNPRYISVSRLFKSKIKEMNDFNLLNDTINQIIYD